MDEIWVTMEIAADLENMSYDAFKKYVKRNSNKIKTKTEPSPIGGRDRVYIAVSSLSTQARKKYYSRNKPILELATPKAPEYNINLAELEACVGLEKFKKMMKDAEQAARPYEEYISFEIANTSRKTELVKEIAKKYDIATATFYRGLEKYRAGGYRLQR